MRKAWRMLCDDSGAALMMAIFTVTLLMIIATEIMYETQVEFVVSSQAVNQVRAHYAAKAGVQISLLRLHIYRKVIEIAGKDMAKQIPMLDMIWQMPFSWPPLVPESASGIDKGEIKTAVKKSKMEGQYLATIESESSKIDLTTLASENEALRNTTIKQLEQIFTSRVETDEKFARKHSGFDFKKFVNNIKDWVDPDDKNDFGGDEKSHYSSLGDAGKNLPPNQPFKTFEELHMVAGMTDEFFKMIAPRVTIFGAKAINVKYASKEVLMAVLSLNEEQVNRLIEERNKKDTTVFKDDQTFYQFLQTLGVRVDDNYKNSLNLLFEPEFNFRIKSVGSSGKVQREITAIVFNYNEVLAQLKKMNPSPSPQPTIPTGNPAPTPTPSPSPSPSAGGSNPASSGPPNIVYWNET